MQSSVQPNDISQEQHIKIDIETIGIYGQEKVINGPLNQLGSNIAKVMPIDLEKKGMSFDKSNADLSSPDFKADQNKNSKRNLSISFEYLTDRDGKS